MKKLNKRKVYEANQWCGGTCWVEKCFLGFRVHDSMFNKPLKFFFRKDNAIDFCKGLTGGIMV